MSIEEGVSRYFSQTRHSSRNTETPTSNISSVYVKTDFFARNSDDEEFEDPFDSIGSTESASSSRLASSDSQFRLSSTAAQSSHSVTQFRADLSRTRSSYETPTNASSRRATRTPASNLNNTSCFGDVNIGCLVAVVEGRGNARGEVGLASICLSNPNLVLCQFSDTRTYLRTLTKIAVLNPAEIIVPAASGAYSSLDPSMSKLYEDIVEKFPDSNVTQIHRKYFCEKRGLQVIKHLCAPEFSSVELQIRHKYYALSAANCLLKYVEFVQNVVYVPKSIKVEFQPSTESMMVDIETAKHVELLASSLNSKSDASLFGVLNKCSTPGGIKQLRATLFQPPVQEKTIEERLDAVEELVQRPEVLSALQCTLGRFCDLDSLLTICAMLPKTDSISAVEQRINQVIGLKHALGLIPNLITALSVDIESTLLNQIALVLKDEAFPIMLEQLQAVISEEARVAKGAAAMRLQRCFAVKSGSNGLLDIARRTYCDLVGDIETLVSELSEAHNLPLKVGFNGQRGYHIVLSRAALTALKGKYFKISQLPSEFLNPNMGKTVVTFTTEALVRADQQGQNALREITLMTNVIIQELICQLRSRIGSLFKLSEAISVLDLLATFADVSSMPNYVRPKFGPMLLVKEARHPVLDKMDVEVVANDIMASPLEANFLVLVGHNMAGKSTYLKQVVLLQIMAQSGCFVPAQKDSVPVFRIADSIFSRVGMSDSIECNASTFAMEMKETAYILSNLGQSSLVVIDELGRGTSAEEGSALCWAICEKFAQSTAFTFLATHFELMTKMESLVIGVINMSFVTELREEAQNDGDRDDGVVHTHKLVRGHLEIASVANYGLFLAKKLRIPKGVLETANTMAQLLRRTDKVLPDVDGEDLLKINCLRLALTLRKLASREDMDISEKIEIAQCLQQQFAAEDNDDMETE